MLFQMLFQSIQCLQITNPSGWLTATAGILLFSLFIQVYFEKSGAWKVFSPESIKRIKFNNGMYLFFLFFCLAGAFQLYRHPSQIAEMVWGFIGFILSIMALTMTSKGMR